MWELDHKEGWAPKNWCLQTAVLEKTLGRPLDSKGMNPVKPKGSQSWIFTGRTNAFCGWDQPLWAPHYRVQASYRQRLSESRARLEHQARAEGNSARTRGPRLKMQTLYLRDTKLKPRRKERAVRAQRGSQRQQGLLSVHVSSAT